MKTKEKHWSWDTIAAVGATLTAVFALSIAIWQGYEQRYHNRLSMKPILVFTAGSLPRDTVDDSTTYTVEITNAGVGPALIKQFEIFLKGDLISAEKYDRHPASLLKIAALMATNKYLGTNSHIKTMIPGKNTTISPGNTLVLLSFQFKESDPAIRENIISELMTIDLQITYTSIYGDDETKISFIDYSAKPRSP